MSETPTTPNAPAAPEPAPRRPSRVTTAAAWVGIVAGIVFIVSTVFFSGFILGKASGHHHRAGQHCPHSHLHGGPMMGHMGPGGPMLPPGPGMRPPRQDGPQTTAPARP